MKTAYSILILNLILCIVFYFEHWIPGLILTGVWMVSAVGLIGFHKTEKKGLAYTAYAGFAPFFPIGFLAIIGIRRHMEQNLPPEHPTASPLQVFYFSRRFLHTYLILGCCLIGLEFVTQFLMRIPTPVGAMGLVFVIMALALRKSELIEVFSDSFTYKPGPLSSRKRIYLDDITTIVDGKKRILLELKSNKRQQKIMTELLEPSDRPKFYALISKHMPNLERS